MTHIPDENEITMLRAEVEMLVAERERLLRAVGAAAVLYARIDPQTLPEKALAAAEVLTQSLNGVSEDVLQEAIELVESEVHSLQHAKRHPDSA
ncbi:MAG: hypothetical protein ACOZDY_14180 [Pseudomonadota bacterium]